MHKFIELSDSISEKNFFFQLKSLGRKLRKLQVSLLNLVDIA